jgi:hypothetical protein
MQTNVIYGILAELHQRVGRYDERTLLRMGIHKFTEDDGTIYYRVALFTVIPVFMLDIGVDQISDAIGDLPIQYGFGWFTIWE